jgi:hypothetical protein
LELAQRLVRPYPNFLLVQKSFFSLMLIFSDVWLSILARFCNIRELCRFARVLSTLTWPQAHCTKVCRRWRMFCNSPVLWRSVDLSVHTIIGLKKTVLALSMNLHLVQKLQAHRVTFGTDVLEPLFRRLRSLRELDLAEATFPSDAVPLILTHCQQLEVLCLAHCKAVQNDDIAHIALLYAAVNSLF